MRIFKSFLTVTARKRFAFVSWFRKQKLILILRFSGQVWKTVSRKMKNASYFPNHGVLIRTLFYWTFRTFRYCKVTWKNHTLALPSEERYGETNEFMGNNLNQFWNLINKEKRHVTEDESRYIEKIEYLATRCLTDMQKVNLCSCSTTQ